MTAPSNNDNNSNNNNDSNKVRVVARIRPLAKYELEKGCEKVLRGLVTDVEPQQLHVSQPESKWYELDAVLDEDCSQEEVYRRSGAQRAVCQDLLKGLNCTILAYGQTGAGKTFSMGSAAADTTEITDDSGIIPRACVDLFQQLEKHTRDSTVQLEYMEVYNEEIRDLLSAASTASSSHQQLRIREMPNGEVYVRGLESVLVKSPTDVGKYMQEASLKRMVASTKMNATSSRSHAICVLRIQGTLQYSSTKFQSKLTLVDLAGSERMKKTGAAGNRAQEGISINKGLFVLGQVVSALSAAATSKLKRKPPYRDSKLTRLLQDSLGGNSRTIMVACVSPADYNVEESINTLRYATSARNITNMATKNVQQQLHLSPEEIIKLKRENELLKAQVKDLEATVQKLTRDVKIMEEELEEARSVEGDGINLFDCDDHDNNDDMDNDCDNNVVINDSAVINVGEKNDSPPEEEREAVNGDTVHPELKATKVEPELVKIVDDNYDEDEDDEEPEEGHSQSSFSMSTMLEEIKKVEDDTIPKKKKSYRQLEKENKALIKALRRGQIDIRTLVAKSGVELPSLKKQVQMLQDELRETALVEEEAERLRQELEESRAEAKAARRAADHLTHFMHTQSSQANVLSGQDLEEKRTEYQQLVANEEWLILVTRLLNSFKEQLRTLGDLFAVVVRLVENPGDATNGLVKSRKRERRFSLFGIVGGGGDGDPKAIEEERKKEELEMQRKLLGDHIKVFNERFLEIEDKITSRSESVEGIQDYVNRFKVDLEEELGPGEFMRNMFYGKAEEIMFQLSTAIFDASDATPNAQTAGEFDFNFEDYSESVSVVE